MSYVGSFAVLQSASTRMDTRFLAERERVRISRLLPLPLDKPVGLIEGGQLSGFFVLVSGWSEPETWGDWADGAQAELVMALPEILPDQSYLKISAEIVAPPGGQQTIQLDAGTIPLGRWQLPSSPAILCARLPAHVAASSGVVRVRIGIGSPQHLPGGLDKRALGFGIRGAELLSGREGCGPSARFPSG